MIDACAFHEWPDTATLAPYLPGGYAEILANGVRIHSPRRYHDPLGATDPAASTDDRPAGSDPVLLCSQLLDDCGLERVVLGYEDGMYSAIHSTFFIAGAVARAANDWTIEEWLSRDPRLHGLVLVASGHPEEAVAEIRRAGAHERMVGVALTTNPAAMALGHPIYHPIYEAAAELQLPIVLPAATAGAMDYREPIVVGGKPSTYTEWQALSWQSQAASLTSLIMQGVFQKYPSLKVLIVGSGALWIPGHLGRMDFWARMVPNDAPWLDRLPSEYFADHFRIATWSLETPSSGPRADLLRQALETMPRVDEVLMYASGYPRRTWQTPKAAGELLPDEWRGRIERENALEFFRWPVTANELPAALGTALPVA